MRCGPLLFFLAGCAATGGDWPSLAVRSAERPNSPVKEPETQPAVEPAAAADLAARSRAVRDQLSALSRQSEAQGGKLAAAIAKSGRSAPDSLERAAAEAELSLMQDLGVQLGQALDDAAASGDPALAADADALLARHRAAERAAFTALDH